MKGINRFKFSTFFLVFAYLLNACTGIAPQSPTSTGDGKSQSMEVAFTGKVEAISVDSITVNGQTVSINASTALDNNIQVGDIVKVEAQVSDSGTVLALKIESFKAEDVATPTVSSGVESTPTPSSPTISETASVTSTPDPSFTQTANGMEKEIFGVVDGITADSVTVAGVTYPFTALTEFKDAIAAGDFVKLHVIVNADGSFTVREIEKSPAMGDGGSNNNGDQSDVIENNEEENDE